MESPSRRHKIAIVAPTCFYYQAPLFRALSASPEIELKVYFCSREAIYGQDIERMYKTDGSWGTEEELLEGYTCTFLRNYSPFPSYLIPIVGLINFGIWREIERDRPDLVILMSWMNPTWWLAVLACVRFHVPFVYMTDANVQAESNKRKWKFWIKKLVLGKLLFRLAAGFLYAGTSNKELYRYYGVPEEKLVPFAYSWGYEALIKEAPTLRSQRSEIRKDLGIPEASFVILFCGRLSKEKAPFQLLQAYQLIKQPNKALAFVGDGELKESMEGYASSSEVGPVYFFGFQNRENLLKFYAVADVLVLPSSRETWGIVVNEALSMGLPAIVSDQVGAGSDLVSHGHNGFIFANGDVPGLAACINDLMSLSEAERQAMGKRSQELIKAWTQRNLAQSLDYVLNSISSRRE